MDVALDPLECHALVVEAGVEKATACVEGWSTQPTEGAEAVVDCDVNDAWC